MGRLDDGNDSTSMGPEKLQAALLKSPVPSFSSISVMSHWISFLQLWAAVVMGLLGQAGVGKEPAGSLGGLIMPLLKEPYPPTPVQFSWILQSLFAAFNVVLLVIISGLFFAFPCRWLAQNGEQVFVIITGLLFLLTFFSLLFLNFSDPGILHQGSDEQGPMTVHVMWVNHRAFRLQWCQKCCFHRPPGTFHCPWCNICVEDFDHHCKWVNNCVGHRNFRFFMLLILSLCLYSGAVLTTSLIFLVRVAHLPFSIDKAVAVLVAVPAAGSLVPVFVLLLLQVLSVSAGERSYEGKCRYIQGYNPFDHGCARNWYLAICAPLGSKYMAEAVRLQRAVGTPWVPRQAPHLLSFPSTLSPPASSVTSSQPQPLGLQREGPQGSGEATTLQERRIRGFPERKMEPAIQLKQDAFARLRETPGGGGGDPRPHQIDI
ncbi:palmitoyltransferase ZDHHC19 [Sorex araneus]|uniref:palmitoyltransferase ZDHHC19 n=1 Tax=Sorex araneus TaxID=42254 RepID=UPI002433840A|nr:palmitoyltransferase ZDHHC19 [Sorex araneus]